MKKTLLSFFVFVCLYSGMMAQAVMSRVDGSPYPYSTAVLPGDTLYLTSNKMKDPEVIALMSLQGLTAKTKPVILRDEHGHPDVVTKNGIVLDKTYYEDFSGLLKKFAKHPQVKGYILCTYGESSVNVAISLAGILNAIVIDSATLKTIAENAGLKKLLNVQGKDEIWALDNYGDKFSKKISSYQFCRDGRGLFLADFSIFCNAFQFWDDNPKGILAQRALDRMDAGGTFFGYVPSEYNTVDEISKRSCVLHPSDFSPNLSTLVNIPANLPKQSEAINSFKVVPNVHTVCFVMSDGDNIQWMSGASDDKKQWVNPNRARVNLGWTVSPSFAELAPIMYKKYLENAITGEYGRNILIAGPSGRGYFLPSDFPKLSDECNLLNKFMKKADLRIVNILDVDDAAHNPDQYLRQPNVDALFYYTYGAQYTGIKGLIKWYNDKPSIGGRFTLWGAKTGGAPENDGVAAGLANLLNQQSKDIYSENGYSLIPVHVWTMNVDDVINCIKKLGPNVRVVAPDEFVWLIRKNIKGLNLGTGNGLRGDYFNGSDFNTDSLKYSQTDAKVDFDWATGSPNKAALGTDDFTVRWSGQVQPVYSEKYTFYTVADDGVKLTINGTLMFDSLNTVGADTLQDTITLVSGQKYDIVLEYKEKLGNAYCSLEWESAKQLRQTIPRCQLYSKPLPSTDVVTAYADCDYKGYYGGLKLGNYKLADLNERGIEKLDIASIKVSNGFKVILYDTDNFTGGSKEITSDTTCLGTWTDKTISLKVLANGIDTIKGTYFLQNRKNNLYVDVFGGAGAVDNGIKVQQLALTSKLNQQYKFTHLGNGLYSIIAINSNKALDIKDFGKDNGAGVQQWTYYGDKNQQYIVKPTGDGYWKIIAANSGKILQSASDATAALINQWTDSEQTNGQWKLKPVPALINDIGVGLEGTYFNDTLLKTKVGTSRIDATINFDWADRSPKAGINADYFSVRWVGLISPRFSGSYTFYINSDNGRRLWVNNQLIIDKWKSDYGTEYSGTPAVSLIANKKYAIKLEYYEQKGGASCKLEWKSDFQPREVVPKCQLFTVASSLTSVFNNLDATIYPNPITNKTMHVNLPNIVGNNETSLTIYDLLGKPVLQTKLRGTGEVSLDKIHSGAYIVALRNKNNMVNKRIIVQ